MRTIALLVLLAAPAAAQPADGAPSPELVRAMRLYDQERYSDAAMIFDSVRAGRTDDAPATRQRAEFFYAKCLFRMQRWDAALVAFERVAEPSHLYFLQALQWFGALWPHLAESPVIVAAVGRYTQEQLERFNDAGSHSTYVRLSYLMGRARFAEHRYAEARPLFERALNDPDVGRDAQAWHHRLMATIGPQ